MENRKLTIENLKRCDNCFFSVWVMSPNRPAKICMQKDTLPGRWQIVLLEQSCSNFYPSSIFKQGSSAVRRIPLTQGKFALVDTEDYYRLVKFPWYTREPASNLFYASRRDDRKSVLMHRVIMNPPGHLVVDHIDRNGLNNCKANLRLCTPAQNVRNVSSVKGGSSRYKGVCWDKIRSKWRVGVRVNNKKHYVGHFADEMAAGKAYDEKAAELHGEFAYLNFPPGKQKVINRCTT